MKHYEVEINLFDEEQQKRMEALEERFKKLNGWNEQSIMQFVIAKHPKFFDALISLAEFEADKLKI